MFDISKITQNTVVKELLTNCPFLKDELAKISDKFKALTSPVGMLAMGKSTIGDLCSKAGLNTSDVVEKIKELIKNHKD